MYFYFLIGIFCALGFLIAFFTLKTKFKKPFCIGWIAVFLFSVLFGCFGPKTPINPLEFDTGIYLKTLNRAVVYLVTLNCFLFQLALFSIIKKPSNNGKDTPLIAGIIIAVFMIAISIGWTVYSVKRMFG